MNKLEVFYKKQLAGILEKTIEDQFIFTYTEDYLNSTSPSISITLPKEKKKFESQDLFAFFDGLIPEGWLLNLASKELRLNPIRDRFELLAKLCQDTIGATHIGTKEQLSPSIATQQPRKSSIQTFGRCLICYEPCNSIYHENCMLKVFGEKIWPMVNIDHITLEALANTQLNKKLAITGVQKKLSLDLQQEDKNYRFTVTNLWGRYILKPRGNPPHLPENEHLCLKLAESFKIVTVASALIPTISGELAFITKRFDRADNNEFHQEDFCQILNKAPYKKYNASLEQIGKILKKHSDYPGDDLYRLYELTLFNYLIGNVDAHLKNLSLIYENHLGMRKLISPAYDLISTDLFIENDNEESALAINGKKNKLNEGDFLALAKSFGISPKVHTNLIKRFNQELPNWELLIDKSFLEDNKKKEFKELIKKKLSTFSSSS